MRGVVHHRENGAQEWNRHKENEREREMLPTPYLLILGGMSSGSMRYGLHAWRSYFSLAVRF